MKQIYLPILFACLIGAGVLSAQNAGCDGIRYKSDVFTTVKKTTVGYAPTVNQVNQNVTLQMDVYEPVGDALGSRPVVILAHGGSFIFGDKSMMQSYCQLLAKQGYVAASIQYRLYPIFSLGYPDSSAIMDAAVKAVGDMKAAVRYFREDAATVNTFHADADHIFIGGYSAGAVTALHAGYLDEGDNIPNFIANLLSSNGGLEGISGTASNHTYDSHSSAIINMSGGIYRNEWIDAQGIPLVSIHGTADATVPYFSGLAANIAYLEGSGVLHPRAESEGVWNFLETVPGGGHTDTYDQPQFAPYLDTFWIHATTLLESLTCALVSTPSVSPASNDFHIYPNPVANNEIALELPASITNAQVVILDATGRIVLRKENYRSLENIQLPGLPAGVYMVQIINPSGGTFAKQLVKQ